jgi:hypothetical protein
VAEAGSRRWTDDRIDDLAAEVRELRAELREEMRELRRWTVNLWATTIIGFVAVLVETSLR